MGIGYWGLAYYFFVCESLISGASNFKKYEFQPIWLLIIVVNTFCVSLTLLKGG